MSEKTGLRKSINWTQGTALTIGAVLGSGILVLPAMSAEVAGAASLISWILMGLFSLPMVITIGSMSSQYPDSGGMATYARQAFGQHMGHLTGILILSAMPLGMPLTALIGAHYLGNIFEWNSLYVHLAAGVMLLLAIALNYRGIELSGRAQVFVVSIILFILSFAVLSAIPQIRGSAFTPFVSHGWKSIGEAMTLLFFAFMGWEMIGNLAEEFKNPLRDIPLSLGIAFVIINFLYLAVAMITVGTNAYEMGNPVTAMITIVSVQWGHLAGYFVAVLGMIVCYCPVHTFIAGFSRLVYAQAREGNFPEKLGQLHPRFQTPHKALLLFIPLFSLVLLLSYLFSLDLKLLIGIPSTIFLFVYIIGMVSAAKILTKNMAKLSGWVSASLSGIVLSFSGWYLLFPLLVVIIFVYVNRHELAGRPNC